MRPLQTTCTELIRVWANAYREHGPSKKNTEQAFGIGLYQMGQAQRWGADKLTVAESAANAFLWWAQCSRGLRIDPWKNLPPSLKNMDERFLGWQHVFNLVHRMQQMVSYGAYSDFKDRNKRFDVELSNKLMSGLMTQCVALMGDNVEEGFYEASNIMIGNG